MAQSTIQSADKVSGTVKGSGLTITYEKTGRVVAVSCGSGKLTAALAAQATLVTLPEGFRPNGNISTPDWGTNGTRVRIDNEGIVKAWVAKAVGDNIIFYVTYII